MPEKVEMEVQVEVATVQVPQTPEPEVRTEATVLPEHQVVEQGKAQPRGNLVRMTALFIQAVAVAVAPTKLLFLPEVLVEVEAVVQPALMRQPEQPTPEAVEAAVQTAARAMHTVRPGVQALLFSVFRRLKEVQIWTMQ